MPLRIAWRSTFRWIFGSSSFRFRSISLIPVTTIDPATQYPHHPGDRFLGRELFPAAPGPRPHHRDEVLGLVPPLAPDIGQDCTDLRRVLGRAGQRADMPGEHEPFLELAIGEGGF
jgi:hypothetical protein